MGIKIKLHGVQLAGTRGQLVAYFHLVLPHHEVLDITFEVLRFEIMLWCS